MTENREVLSCPHCGLVQFRTRNSHCRRCQRSLDDRLEDSICTVPDPVNSTTTAIENRLDVAQIVGRRVREIRKMQALSQRQLAGRLNVPRTYLSKVETCKVLPTIGTLYRLAGALRAEVHHLLVSREVLELSQDPFLVEIASMIHSLAPEQKAVILRAVREMAIRRNQAA
jgi:transcriptional regulator with XRE-family HTH domain